MSGDATLTLEDTVTKLIISGGLVRIEDGIKKTEEYAPPRKATVEIRFEVPEGADGQAFADQAVAAADKTLRAALNQSAAPAAVVAAAPQTPAPAPEKSAPKPRGAAKPKELTDKDKLAKAVGLPVDDGLGDGAQTNETPAASEDDGLGDLLGDSAPAPVTDAELGKAAQEHNGRLKAEHGEKHNPAVIRKLITEYAGENKKITDIPANKRHAFIDALKALK